MISRGIKHSQAIKRSVRWDDWLANRKAASRIREIDTTRGWLELAEKAWGDCGLGLKLVRVCKYSDDAIQQQLREHWKAGYVAALNDVKTERERQERNRYLESMPTISMQEAASISHVYEKRLR